MKHKYYTTRAAFFNKWEGRYTAENFIKTMYSDYEGIIDVYNDIPEDRFIYKNANWKLNLTRFLRYEINDDVPLEELEKTINRISANNDLVEKTPEEMIEWIKERTDLIEEETGKFLIREAYEDVTGEQEAIYLNII